MKENLTYVIISMCEIDRLTGRMFVEYFGQDREYFEKFRIKDCRNFKEGSYIELKYEIRDELGNIISHGELWNDYWKEEKSNDVYLGIEIDLD